MVVALLETIYQFTVITTDFTHHTRLQTNLSTVATIHPRLSEAAIICYRSLMSLFLFTMNKHIPPARRSHSSIPKDIRYMQSHEGYFGRILPHNGHHSLPKDGYYSAEPDNNLAHKGQYKHRVSYLSSQPSEENSLSWPPVPELSRQSSSWVSSHAPSGKSNMRMDEYNSTLGSHVSL